MRISSTNVLKKILQVLFILALPLLLFTVSLSAVANSAFLYEWGFAKYKVSNETGVSAADLNRVAHGLIGYWNNGDETFNITVARDGAPFVLFNDKEIKHLVDVKNLFRLLYQCLLGSFLYAAAFLAAALFWWKDRRMMAAGLAWGSGLSILLMAVLGIMAITDFQWLFWQFHIVSFTNDLWLLDPSTDYLLMLFPEGFFFDMAMIFSGLMIFLALVLGFTGWRMLKARPRLKPSG